jgi:hypothetical protein
MERAMLDENTRKELIEKHGPIADVDTPDGRTIAVKKPPGHVYQAFMGKVSKENANKASAISDLVRESLVYPADQAEVSDILEKFPGVVLPLSGAITEMVGATGEARIRKN